VAAWNQLSVVMLVESKNRVIGRTEFPNGLASTYSKIAYHSFGWGGVYIIDLSVVATLLGVCVSYQMGFAQMLQQVLLSAEKLVAFSRYEVLIGLSAVLVTPLSCSRDLGMLSHASLLGLVALVVGVAFIFVYGLQVHNAERYEPLPLWPQDVAGVASFLGISTFCFGICALGNIINIGF
jgi:amino acid permease